MQFQIDDEIVAIVDHPEDNHVIKKGDLGRVAYVTGTGSVLVDWHVEPNGRAFHNGNSAYIKLPQPTGWWVYKSGQIERVEEDNPIMCPSAEEFDALFI